MDNYHITKEDDHWEFKKEGHTRAYIRSDTKYEIIQQMQYFMKDKIGSVKIHNQDGSIEEERTYPRKDDPKKSKG
jgi:hypothetical protein